MMSFIDHHCCQKCVLLHLCAFPWGHNCQYRTQSFSMLQQCWEARASNFWKSVKLESCFEMLVLSEKIKQRLVSNFQVRQFRKVIDLIFWCLPGNSSLKIRRMFPPVIKRCFIYKFYVLPLLRTNCLAFVVFMSSFSALLFLLLL